MPNVETPESRTRLDSLDDVLDRGFDVLERLLTAGVGVALIALAAMALWDTVVLVHSQLEVHDLTRAITVVVDTVFLTIILLELLHTVIARESLSRQAVDFIIIGITSGIRHGLGLVATAANGGEKVTRYVHGQKFEITVPGSGNPRETVISLAINAGGVLLLVMALWLVRHRIDASRDQEKSGRQ